METMKRRLAFFVAATIALGIGFGAAVCAWAQDEDEGPMSNMHFVVLREANGKPVRNAAVVLHPVTPKGKQAMGGLELKTDDEGKAGIDGIPYGPLRVQVLAPGFQTFGEDYKVNGADMVITIKLKRPVGQYSTYGVQETRKADGKRTTTRDRTRIGCAEVRECRSKKSECRSEKHPLGGFGSFHRFEGMMSILGKKSSPWLGLRRRS